MMMVGLLTATTATAESPFIGTWSGIWKGKFHDGQSTQITISMTDAGKLAVAHRRDNAEKDWGVYQRFMPPGVGNFPATLEGDALHLGVAKKITYVLFGTLASSAWGAEQPTERLIGTWVSQDENQNAWSRVEIEIAGIDERGRATGVYCSTRPDGSFFGFELRPKGGVKTSMKKGRLTFARGKRKYALAANEDGTMSLDFKNKGKKSPTATMEHGAPSGCLTRITPVGESVSHSVSADDETELVGVWAGKTNKRGLEIEIHLAHVSGDGQATGLYCWTRKDRSIVAFDVGPGAPTQTTMEDGTLKAPRNNVSFDVRPKGEDRLEFTFRKDGRKQLGAKLKRSEAKGCLTRIRMLGAVSGG